jgi:predicted O-methyltransferase YrrM
MSFKLDNCEPLGPGIGQQAMSLDATKGIIARPHKHTVDYAPTWDWGDEFLGDQHRLLLHEMPPIDGLMYPQDALKLYELAWFSPGPILEIGTYHGLSAAVMATSLNDSNSPQLIYSLDVDPAALNQARQNLKSQGLLDRVTLAEGSVRDLVRVLPNFRPMLVFVDGDHTLWGAISDLEVLYEIVPTGGIVAMHDYEGYQNSDAYWTQVRQGVHLSWMTRQCRFLGRFGLIGVFQRVRGPQFLEHVSAPSEAPILRLRQKRKRFSSAWLVTHMERTDLPGLRFRRELITLAARLQARRLRSTA